MKSSSKLLSIEGVDTNAFSADAISDNASESFSFEQISDLSVEKNLSDAVIALNNTGKVIGLQAIGSGGIASAAAEMAARGKSGIELNADKVPAKEDGLTGREILLSETWGRILVCIDKSDLQDIMEVLMPRQLAFSVVGKVVEGKELVCKYNEEVIAAFPASYVGKGGMAPSYERAIQAPESASLKPLIVELIIL